MSRVKLFSILRQVMARRLAAWGARWTSCSRLLKNDFGCTLDICCLPIFWSDLCDLTTNPSREEYEMSEQDYGDCEENQKSRNNGGLEFLRMKHSDFERLNLAIAMIPVSCKSWVGSEKFVRNATPPVVLTFLGARNLISATSDEKNARQPFLAIFIFWFFVSSRIWKMLREPNFGARFRHQGVVLRLWKCQKSIFQTFFYSGWPCDFSSGSIPWL